jgi:dihydroorotase
LINGLVDGTIDAIESQHTPLAIENKELEFEYANFGISGIEIAFQTIFKITISTNHRKMP